MSAFLVSSISFIALAFLCQFAPAKRWWASFRASPGTSLVLVMAMTVPFLGGQRASVGESGLESASGVRLVRVLALILLLGIAAFGILRDRAGQHRAGWAAWCVVFYALLAMGSAAYSISPFISLWKGFEVFVLALTGIFFATRLQSGDDIQRLLGSLWLVLFYLVLTALSGLLIVPHRAIVKLEISSATVIEGVYPIINANTLTQFAVLLSVVCIVLILQRDRSFKGWANYLVLLIAGTTAVLAHSRTSIFAGMLAIVLALHFLGRRMLVRAAIVVVPLVWIFSEALARFISRGQSEEVFMSLSGRTLFWDRVWESILQSPIIGHGFYAAQRGIFGVSSVDNTYLEVLLGLGIVGLIVFVIPVVITGVNLIQLRPRTASSAAYTAIWLQLLALFVLLFVRSLTGPSFQVMHWNLVMVMVLHVSCAALRRQPQSRPSVSTGSPRRRVVAPSLLR